MMRNRAFRYITIALFLCLTIRPTKATEIDGNTHLFDDPQWHALVHYRPTLFGGVKSTIDSEEFFLAPDGKTNPAAELQATRDLFMGTDTQKQCLFPARYRFLQDNHLIQKAFPDCPEYTQFRKDLNPAGLTLLYTDAYMNNPASLFGHTLMRIDIPEGRTQLVAHGVNYGAFVSPDENGILFAVLGLTGGYQGGFTVKPYYSVINTYNNIENRDIWEFHLNLTPTEQDRFVAHLWELGHTRTRYFFFTENCSYLLMETLDAVRPTARLADDFPAQTIPLDTLKAVAERPGLVDHVQYRPSRQKRIAASYNRLDKRQKKALLTFLQNETLTNTLSPTEQAAVLETAYEYTQYQWEAQTIPLDDYRRRSFRLLKERRALPTTQSTETITTPSPLTAHDAKRLLVAQGWERGHSFQEISFRPAYHSLTEQPDGLLPGSEINFLNTTLRYYTQRNKLVLQQLDIVNIYSVSPRTPLFHPISYQIKADIRRIWNPQTDREGMTGVLSGGSGVSFEIYPHIFAFGFGKTTLQYGGILPHNIGIGIGAETGFLAYLPDTQIKVSAERLFSDNWYLNQTTVTSEVVYNIARNWGVGLSYDWQQTNKHTTNTLRLNFRHFF